MKTLQNFVIPFLILISPVSLLAQVDYEDDIQPIFDQYCTSCHGSSSGVDLSNYEAVMNSVGNQYQTEIVEPGSPDESPLVDKIEPQPQFGSRMPQGGPFLSSEEIELIRTWISEGANEMATSQDYIAEIPNGFKLKENFPNPFNPVTTISFDTPVTSQYNIEIYASNGVLVKEVSGLTSSSNTRVSVNLQDQPTGTYFYRVKITLKNRSFWLETKKMTLVK